LQDARELGVGEPVNELLFGQLHLRPE
jgi:hypothetical protein